MIKRLIQLSLHQRSLTLIAAVALCLYGLYSTLHLPIDVLPDLNRPTVSILTEAPGLSPEEVELRVTMPIEAAVSGASGLERVRSTSALGLSVVYAEFGWGAGASGGNDIRFHRLAVQERLALAAETLPEGVTPHLGPVSSIMGEIMLMGVSSETLSPMDIRDAAEWTLRPAILSIPGIAQVTVQGGEVRQFQVRADPELLRLYGLTLDDLKNAVTDSNRDTSGGYLNDHGNELIVRNLGRARSASDIANALVATRTAGDHAVPVRVRDVAHVLEGPSIYKRGDASINGKPGVILAIAKQPGADSRALIDAIEARIASMRATLPPDLSINTELFRQSDFINRAIDNVAHALRDGSILVIIVLGLFLLNARATLVTLTAIPLSLLATAAVFHLLGQSINTMTLGGVAVATGELVDDAVVGVENTLRRLRESLAARRAAAPIESQASFLSRTIAAATFEVRAPILVGTAIVLLTFVPLVALPGLAGRLFAPLAWAYILSILASMGVSLTVTPALCHLLLPAGGRLAAERESPVLRFCKSLALRAYNVALPRPMTVVAISTALVVAAGVTLMRLGAEFLPPFNEGTATVTINAVPGISLDESNRLGVMAEKLLLDIPEVKSLGRRVGRAEQDEHALGVNSNEIEVAFWSPDEVRAGAGGRPLFADASVRKPPATLRTLAEVFADIRAKLALIPGVTTGVGQPIGHRVEHLQSGVEAQVVLKIFGPELPLLRRAADETMRILDTVPGVADLGVEQQTLIPELHVRVDPDRAARYGFTVGDLTDTLETALRGTVVSKIIDGLRRADLVVLLDDPWRAEPDTLGDVRLLSPTGAVALVSDVAEIREMPAPNEINRENAQRRVIVHCNVEGRDLATTVGAIREAIDKNLQLPHGYLVQYEGQHESQREATRSILLLSSLALLVMFVLLRATLRSSMLAAQVLLNVPFAFIGAVAALLITRQPFSVASLVGFISLCGIAARNGVLMISHYQHLMIHEGIPFGRELVVRGSQERVAPVLMTALTTGLALIPLALASGEPGKEILHPVAVVILGGLVTCTLLDFFVTPTVFLKFAGPAARRAAELTKRSLEPTP
ncbi:MAG TPA: efflux RND transporter permease subunit [Phycisphaerales bacterium]|nr:efflux RND transporter permease subunit [Phycisphaerales bacterium]